MLLNIKLAVTFLFLDNIDKENKLYAIIIRLYNINRLFICFD